MKLLIYIFMFMFFLMMLLLNKHFLIYLITIEFLMITNIYFIMYFNNNNILFLIYLIMIVCEAVLGLSLMVSLNFNIGHQNIQIMNMKM